MYNNYSTTIIFDGCFSWFLCGGQRYRYSLECLNTSKFKVRAVILPVADVTVRIHDVSFVRVRERSERAQIACWNTWLLL